MEKYKTSIFNIPFDKEGITYIYNTMSGSLIKLDDASRDAFEQTDFDFTTFDSHLLEKLLCKGFIVKSHIDEMGMLYEKTNEAIYSSFPSAVSYTIVLTNKCNYSCKYCFEAQNKQSNNATIDVDKTVSFILKQIEHNKELKYLRITWFGGEPLIYEDGIDIITGKLLPVLSERKIKYTSSIITNGYLISDQFIDNLEKNQISSIQITLDGMPEVYADYKGTAPGAFDRVLSNIKKICTSKSSCSVGIRLNCDKDNIASIFSLLDYLDASGFFANCNINLAPITGSDGSEFSDSEYEIIQLKFYSYLCDKGYKELVKKKLKKSRLMSCGYVGSGSYIIDVDGTLKKCERYVGMQDKVVGDVILGRYYNSAEREFQLNDILDKCMSCSLYPICRGGCKNSRLSGKEIDCHLQRDNLIKLLNMLV